MESIALTLFDYILVTLIMLSGTTAFFRGFVKEILSLLLWIIAFVASISINGYLDSYFSNYISNPEIRRMVLIIIIFIGIIFFGGFVIKFIRRLIKSSGMGGLDKIFGILFGLIRGIILIMIIFLILPSDFKQSSFFNNSKSSYYLKKYTPMAEKLFQSMISNKNSAMLDSNSSKIYETT